MRIVIHVYTGSNFDSDSQSDATSSRRSWLGQEGPTHDGSVGTVPSPQYEFEGEQTETVRRGAPLQQREEERIRGGGGTHQRSGRGALQQSAAGEGQTKRSKRSEEEGMGKTRNEEDKRAHDEMLTRNKPNSLRSRSPVTCQAALKHQNFKLIWAPRNRWCDC